jgi:lantibiotic biosynthesis protein
MKKEQESPLYQVGQSFLVRIPVSPVERLFEIWKMANEELVDSLTGSERSALLLRSLSLDEDLQRLKEGRRQDKDVARAVYRYLVRMASRATPYGTFASVALGHFGKNGAMGIETVIDRTRTRFDASWLMSVTKQIESDAVVRPLLKYYWHEGARFQGGWVVLYQIGPGDNTPVGNTQWIGRSRALEAIAKAAKTGAAFSDLCRIAKENIPQNAAIVANELVNVLCKKGFLVSELHHPVIGDPVPNLLNRIQNFETAQSYRRAIQGLQNKILTIDSNGASERINQTRSVLREMRAMFKGKTGNYIQIDATAGLKDFTLPESVASELSRAVEVLLRLSRFPLGQADFEGYQKRFRDRYEYGSEVPLLELVDSIRGIGMPERVTEDARVTRRDPALLRLAANALHFGDLEIQLTDSVVEELATCDLSEIKLPRSFDVVTMIGAASAENLAAGDFRIVIGPGVGALVGGKHFGRFADILGVECRNLLREVAHTEQAWDPNCLEIELVFSPADQNHLNVCSRDIARPYVIYYGVPPGPIGDRRVFLSDLVVGLRGSEFYVRWTRENVEIRPGAWHMLNPRLAPDPLRFLFDLYLANQPALTGFSWGVAAQLPRTPRVTRGKVILCPAQWRLFHGSELHIRCSNETFWNQVFDKWRAIWKVPRFVHSGRGDKRVLLNLDDERDRMQLREQLKVLSKDSAVVISELVPAFEDTWLKGPAGRHMCEIVVPFLLCGKGHWKPRNEQPHSIRPFQEQEKLPGSEWLYVELYTPPSHMDALLAGPILSFARDLKQKELINKWFFIRYSENGHHVRLRFNGHQEKLTASVLPMISSFVQRLRFSGWISRFEFCSYRREELRYGGPLSLNLVEDIFSIDSSFCAALIDILMRERPGIDRCSIAAWTTTELLDSLAVSRSQQNDLLRHAEIADRPGGKIFRKDKLFLRQAFSGDLPIWIGDSLFQQLSEYRMELNRFSVEISKLFSQKLAAKTVDEMAGSLAHMHCNRFIGTESRDEQIVNNLLLRTRQSLQASPSNAS